MRTRLLAEIYRRNPLLALVGWLHVVLLLATVVGFLTDDRMVMGINTWLKPMKFMFSLILYLWTVAWFSKYIRRPRWALGTVSLIIAAVILVESGCLLLQAARGTLSHYNVATDFDAAVFRTMGIMIGINTLMVAIILFMFGRPAMRLPPAYLWGIRLGLVFFLAGGAIGGVMLANNAHTVGAPDGGPGLPFLNWSRVGGDLRIAHGMALHALQIMPLTGFAISRWRRVPGNAAKLGLLALAALVYGAAVLALFRQAMAGKPFI